MRNSIDSDQAPPEQGSERSVVRMVLFALGRFALGLAVPILIVVVLAILAQLVISGH
jgi:hypothetical protein